MATAVWFLCSFTSNRRLGEKKKRERKKIGQMLTHKDGILVILLLLSPLPLFICHLWMHDRSDHCSQTGSSQERSVSWSRYHPRRIRAMVTVVTRSIELNVKRAVGHATVPTRHASRPLAYNTIYKHLTGVLCMHLPCCFLPCFHWKHVRAGSTLCYPFGQPWAERVGIL